MLTSVSRTSGSSQLLGCSYDSFGNLTGVNVGSILLASYEYAAKNGNLLEQTYGNGDTVSFTYDHLGRVVESTYSSGRVLRYTYTGDGQVYSITDNNGTSSTGDDLVYRYTYDTLGRVIHCQAQRGIQVLLETHWEYDEYSRVKSQGWQMGTASYKETFAYSEEDGSLVSITTQGGGATLSMSYDPLQRLSTEPFANSSVQLQSF